jgi:hypothetical protein
MPANNFTVGKDISLVIQAANGPLDLSQGITDFSADPMTTDLISKNLNGVRQTAVIPDGWKGSFKIDRMSPVLDNFWAAFEAAYYQGSNQVAGTIYETITEADKSVTQWRYTGVTLKLEKAGDFSGDKKVEQTLSFMASQRIKVS